MNNVIQQLENERDRIVEQIKQLQDQLTDLENAIHKLKAPPGAHPEPIEITKSKAIEMFRDLVEDSGMGYAQVARLIGCSSSTPGSVLRGDSTPSLHFLKAALATFNVIAIVREDDYA